MADVKKSRLHYMRLPTPPATPSQPAEPNSPGKDVPGCKQWTWKASNSGASGPTLPDSCASQEPFHAVARCTLTLPGPDGSGPAGPASCFLPTMMLCTVLVCCRNNL